MSRYYVYMPNKKREKLVRALANMPDEAFDWFALACPEKAMTQGGNAQIWPDGIGGFTNESRKSITDVREEAKQYIEEKRNATES